MPVIVPTTEFVGLLNDCIPFALDDPEFPSMCCVRIAWDGEQLQTQAHDGQHMAWSRWHPDDDPTDGEAQESMLDPWGGDDDPWAVVVSLKAAKELAKLFKLGDKQMWTPLAVDARPDGSLRVTRHKAPGVMGIETTVERLAAGRDFPDFEEVLAQAYRPQPVERIAFNAEQLSHFATVRQRGPMAITFNGPRLAARIQIGERFDGAVTPTRIGEQRLQAVA